MKMDHPSGFIEKQVRYFSDFNGVVLQCSGNLYLSQGDSSSIIIETDNDMFPFITTFINGTTLYISNCDRTTPTKLNIYITLPKIKTIELEGSGNVFANKPIRSDWIIVILGGTGNIELDSIYANRVKFSVDGSGELKVKGVGDISGASVSGSGNLNIMEFLLNKLNATIEGSGNIYANPKNELSAIINGSGNIFYKDNPIKINNEINGTGKVIKLDK